METTNIYILIDPENQQVRYVGKANNISERYKAHLNRARKHQIHKLNWINSLRKKGLKPIIKIIDIVPINDWVFWETYWIAQFKAWGFKLINYTNGGDGATFSNQTSFKKGHIPWNNGTAKPKILKGNRGKTENSVKNYFKPAHTPWNTDLKGVKLKPDKNVFQYSAYTGEFIKEWKTAKEAGQILDINIAGIANCCRGVSKSAGGYIWKYYKQEKIEIMENVKLKIKKLC